MRAAFSQLLRAADRRDDDWRHPGEGEQVALPEFLDRPGVARGKVHVQSDGLEHPPRQAAWIGNRSPPSGPSPRRDLIGMIAEVGCDPVGRGHALPDGFVRGLGGQRRVDLGGDIGQGASPATASLDATGHATLTIPAGTAAGTRTITAHYNGHLSFSPSTSTAIALRVLAAPTTSSPSTTINPPVPGSSPFVPGPGQTGDSRQGGSPLKEILLGVALGSALVFAVRPRRRRGKHS
jgi:hypothetical protein